MKQKKLLSRKKTNENAFSVGEVTVIKPFPFFPNVSKFFIVQKSENISLSILYAASRFSLYNFCNILLYCILVPQNKKIYAVQQIHKQNLKNLLL